MLLDFKDLGTVDILSCEVVKVPPVITANLIKKNKEKMPKILADSIKISGSH